MLPPTNKTQLSSSVRFGPHAWWVLVIALALIIASAAQKAYRLTLPTDGWNFTMGAVGSVDEERPTHTANLLGLPSPLHPDDRLLAVEGRSLELIRSQAISLRVQSLPNWRTGQTVGYTVERAGQPIILDVPLYTWPVGIVLRALATDALLIAALLLAAVGWFVFLQRPQEWAARPLLLFSVCLFVVSISNSVITWSLPELLTPGLYPIATFFSNWIFLVVMFPSLLLLTLLFPRPKLFVLRQLRLFVALVYGIPMLVVLLAWWNVTLAWVMVLAMAMFSLAALVHSFVTVHDPIGRAQMRWAVSGLALMVLGFIPINLSGYGILPSFLLPWLDTLLFPLLLLCVTLGFGVAILRYRLFDIDIIIRRTLQYSVLTVTLALIYFGSVVLLQQLFLGVQKTSPLIIVISTLAIAAIFQPLRERIQAMIDRRFYRRKYNAEQVLAAFSAGVRNEMDLEQLSAAVLAAVQETMQPTQAVLWLAQPRPYLAKARSLSSEARK
jgi:hypothetical protein